VFRNKSFPFIKKREEKSCRQITLREVLQNEFTYNTSPRKFIGYYLENCPVFVATKLISDACSSIDILIKDTVTGEFIYEHPLLKLLKSPNPFKDGRLLMKEIAGFYIMTGNSYLNVIGNLDPVELDTIKPQLINIEANSSDGYAQSYSVNTDYGTTYKRDQDNKFIDSSNNQLIHLKDLNPTDSSDNLLGLSTFVGCQLEISQYILASVHNNALLENGARPDGMMTYKGAEPLSDDQVVQIREILQAEFTGASNAGKSTFLNGEFNWTQLSQSVKDMDFATLKKSVAENVANAAKIPLPMISPDNMTLSNMDSAKYAFYDNAVLPVFKQILSFLTQDVLSRYNNSENLELSFDESSIEAIANRKIDAALRSSQTGVLTTNEIRTIMGYESLESGGDTIYQPMNLVPIGQDGFTSDNRTVPSQEKAIFIKTMQEGGYSKKQINKAIADYYDNPKSS
jgi:HK97 family phage portal protein